MLFVRTDANSTIGVGHAMRCLALVETWLTTDSAVTFAVGVGTPDAILERIKAVGATGVRVVDASDAFRLAQRVGATRIVIDGYHLKEEQSVLARQAPLLVVDDEGESATSVASIILNQNPYASSAFYESLDARPVLLLGPKYVLLRREFNESQSAGRAARGGPTRVLVSMGGSDPQNLTHSVAAALLSLEHDIEVSVIVGAANPRAAEITPELEGKKARVYVAVDNMASHMRDADVAIVAAGSTCWELARLGVPMLVVATADNQRAVARAVESFGIGLPLGRPGVIGKPTEMNKTALQGQIASFLDDEESRARMSSKGQALIDGQGAARVCDALRKIEGVSP